MPGEAVAFFRVTERVSPFAFGLGEGRELPENAVTSGCSVAERARKNQLEQVECLEAAVTQSRPEAASWLGLGWLLRGKCRFLKSNRAELCCLSR